MAPSSLGDWKQVQDARFHKGFRRKWKQIRHVKKVYFVKTKSPVSFRSLMQRWSILEAGHCVFLEVVSIFPPLVLVKKNTAKGKEALISS